MAHFNPNASSKLARAVASVVDGHLPPLTAVDRHLPKPEKSKTNPPQPATPVPARLSPRLRAVARLMAEGKTNPQIAVALGVTRQAIWKWSTRPDLLAEVERMQAELLKLSGAKLTAIYRH